MNIEFGSGENPTMAGFKTCDIRNVPGVDFVCPAWEIERHVELNTVDEIFSRHFFEHLTFIQGEKVLQAWYNILKPGGKMSMMLPNMAFHINQWLQRSNMDHAKAGFWGWQREGEFDLWDVHKSGYDFQLLEQLLKDYNFRDIKSLKKVTNKHLYVECYKPAK